MTRSVQRWWLERGGGVSSEWVSTDTEKSRNRLSQVGLWLYRRKDTLISSSAGIIQGFCLRSLEQVGL